MNTYRAIKDYNKNVRSTKWLGRTGRNLNDADSKAVTAGKPNALVSSRSS